MVNIVRDWDAWLTNAQSAQSPQFAQSKDRFKEAVKNNLDVLHYWQGCEGTDAKEFYAKFMDIESLPRHLRKLQSVEVNINLNPALSMILDTSQSNVNLSSRQNT